MTRPSVVLVLTDCGRTFRGPDLGLSRLKMWRAMLGLQERPVVYGFRAEDVTLAAVKNAEDMMRGSERIAVVQGAGTFGAAREAAALFTVPVRCFLTPTVPEPPAEPHSCLFVPTGGFRSTVGYQEGSAVFWTGGLYCGSFCRVAGNLHRVLLNPGADPSPLLVAVVGLTDPENFRMEENLKGLGELVEHLICDPWVVADELARVSGHPVPARSVSQPIPDVGI